MNINTGAQQDLRFLAARFNQKGCWQVWGWRCPKLPLDLFQFQKMDPFFFLFLQFYHMEKALGGNAMSSCMYKKCMEPGESNLCSPFIASHNKWNY
jgi:hypothetical protein